MEGGKTDGTDSRRVRREHYHASCWWRCHKYAYIYCDTGIGEIKYYLSGSLVYILAALDKKDKKI